MNTLRLLPLVLALTSTVACAQTAGVQRLAWLAGCWSFTTGERTVDEQWMAPRAGSMQGMSRTIRSERLIEHEAVILRERGDQLDYEVSPSGQAKTVFSSVSVGDNGIVFENLQHDFPQRIGYRRTGDQLLAWIEGPRNGAMRRIEYPYQRVACPGG
jgi:Domain of unknown function (DUF6265)